VTGDVESQGVEPCEEDPNSLRAIRKAHIQRVLKNTGHNLELTARVLEIPVSQLRRMMTELEIQ